MSNDVERPIRFIEREIVGGRMTNHAAGPVGMLMAQLDRLRRQAGMSFRDLSKVTGLPVSTLHNALRGRVVPRLETVLSVVRACGQDEAWWREQWTDVTAKAGPDVVPRELPRAARAFAGRKAELTRLAELLEREHDEGVGIIAVHGMPGVGKTAFAVRAAREVSGRFPDGQLFVELRAHRPGADPVTPAEALPALLRSLGVPGQALPSTPDGLIRLYRSILSDRRVLVLLDDAFDAEQARALVPSGKGGMLIVTSRHRLDGILALDGAHAIHLDVLTAAESQEILTHLLGEGDTSRHEAYAQLGKLCGYLPLALRVAAANLALEPQVPIAEAVAELAGDPMTALRMPADGQVAVQAAFAQSYQRLSSAASALLRRMGEAPCAWFTVGSAAALLDLPEHHARRALEELTTRCLLDKQAGGRYRMHDLIRLYAADRAREEDLPAVGEAALDRLLDGYRRKAEAAARLLYPERLRLPSSTVDDAAPDVSFQDQRQALAMLDAELENIAAVVAHAAKQRPQPAVWHLADALRGYFVLRLRLPEWIAVAEAGLHAAETHGVPQPQGAMRHSLGVAFSHQGDHLAALHHLTRALDLYRSVAWAAGCAAVLVCLGDIYLLIGRLDEASAALEEAIDLATQHGMPALEAAALGDLGAVYRDRGLLHLAHEQQLRTARRCLDLGMSRGHAIALVYLGLVCLDLGDPAFARRHLADAYEQLAALGSRDGEAYAAIGLVAVEVAVADASGAAVDLYADALAKVDKAMGVVESIADYSLIVEASLVRAEVLRRLGRPKDAAEQARRACDVASEQGYQRGLVRALVVSGGARLDLGDIDAARDYCRRALDLGTSRGYHVSVGNALTLLAALDHAGGDDVAATDQAHQALDVHRRTGYHPGEVETLRLLNHLSAAARTRRS